MLLRGYGMDTKRKEAFHWKKEDVFFLLELAVLTTFTTLLG